MRVLRLTVLVLLLVTTGFLLGQAADSRVGQKSVPATKQASADSDAEPSEVAFRVKGMRNGRAYGTFVTRVDDKWVEIDTTPPPSLPK